jgi:DNA-binding NarL/FixJ family response regulator
VPLGAVLPAATDKATDHVHTAASMVSRQSTVSGQSAVGVEFLSGRRAYRSRTFRLDPTVRNGRRPEHLTVVVLERAGGSPATMARCKAFHLTDREAQTVSLMAQGLTVKEIASAMHISSNTVKSFIKLVMVKIGAPNRASVIAKIFEGATLP